MGLGFRWFKNLMLINDKDTIYIIPIINDKPIKIFYEGVTIEDEFADYFEKFTGSKPDIVEWDEEGLTLEASHILTKKEKEKLFASTKYGVWNIT